MKYVVMFKDFETEVEANNTDEATKIVYDIYYDNRRGESFWISEKQDVSTYGIEVEVIVERDKCKCRFVDCSSRHIFFIKAKTRAEAVAKYFDLHYGKYEDNGYRKYGKVIRSYTAAM